MNLYRVPLVALSGGGDQAARLRGRGRVGSGVGQRLSMEGECRSARG